jgi:hypothetical protein
MFKTAPNGTNRILAPHADPYQAVAPRAADRQNNARGEVEGQQQEIQSNY